MSGTEEEDETMKINISKNQRIDETIEGLEAQHKTKFAGELSEYVENNLEMFAVNQMTQSLPKPLFEAARETTPDRLMKMKLIKKYNELMSKFSDATDMDKEFDIGIPCDLLLDLLRYEDKEILNPSLVVQDYKACLKSGNPYTAKDFFKRIKNAYLLLIVKEIFKLIVRAKDLKLIKSQMKCALQLSDAIIDETQMDMKGELSKVIRNIISQMTGSFDESSMMQSSGRSGALGTMQSGYA